MSATRHGKGEPAGLTFVGDGRLCVHAKDVLVLMEHQGKLVCKARVGFYSVDVDICAIWPVWAAAPAAVRTLLALARVYREASVAYEVMIAAKLASRRIPVHSPSTVTFATVFYVFGSGCVTTKKVDD